MVARLAFTLSLAAAIGACGKKAQPTPAASATPAPAPTRRLVDAGSPPTAAASDLPPVCPDGMVRVTKFCIDQYEDELVATNGETPGLILPHNARPEEGVHYVARSVGDVFPQGYVSRVEAAAACEEAGKRLCTMREWRRACEGNQGTTFPYGDEYVKGKCNSGKQHLLMLKYGPDSRKWRYDEHFNDPALLVEPGFLMKTGESKACQAEGVFDMVGNLHEWVSDTVDQAFVSRFEAEDVQRHAQPWKEGNGIFMGGFFSTSTEHGPGCKFTTIAHEPTYHDYSIGFRCCAQARLPEEPVKKKGN